MILDDATIRSWQNITGAGTGGYTTHTRVTIQRPDGTAALNTIPVSALEWEFDATSTLPTSGRLVVPAIDYSDPLTPVDFRPASLLAPLSPFGNRAHVDMGVDDGINPVVWLPVGVGLITEVTYNRPAENLEVQVGDLGLAFTQAVTTVDWSITAPTRVQDIVDILVTSAGLPTAPRMVDVRQALAATFTGPVTWPPGTALWEILQAVVQAVQPECRAWFDRDGSLLIDRMDVDTAAPPPAQLPAYVLKTGTGGHITEMQTVLSRDGAVNLVAVAVEDTEVVDPTYANITGDESDMAQARRKKIEDVAGTGTGFSKKVTLPGGRRGGFTNKQPTAPRWPFMDPGAHPQGAVFGQQGSVWANNTHYGTDFSAPNSGQVVAVCQGKIIAAYPNQNGPESGWAGKYVVQQASDGSRFMYCHLDSIQCQVGDFLLRQANIGQAGDTGKAFGKHLHLERRVAPYRWATDCRDWRRAGDVK